MKKFKHFLTEGRYTKNLHIEHLEDLVLSQGLAGSKIAINFLNSFKNAILGEDSNIHVGIKYDGSPSVIAGINPENGKFFVGTKSVFNKNTPKVNYTVEDINRNHPSRNLNMKLKLALEHLSKLNIEGVIQGDLLYTKKNLKVEFINNQSFITFCSNTLTYGVPVGSDLGKRIQESQMGVIFHTRYLGETLSTMNANINIDISELQETKEVWYENSNYRGKLDNFSEEAINELSDILKESDEIIQNLDVQAIDKLSKNQKLKRVIRTFHNNKIKEGRQIPDSSVYVNELIEYVENKFTRESHLLNTQEGRVKKLSIGEYYITNFFKNKDQLRSIFKVQELFVRAKNILLNNLDEDNRIKTFVEGSQGLEATSGEGFVCVNESGDVIKLINRSVFSYLNFNIPKNW